MRIIINKYNARKNFLVMLFLYFIFPFYIHPVGGIMRLLLYALCVSWLLIFVKQLYFQYRTLKHRFYIQFSILFIILLLLWSTIVPIVYDTWDWSYASFWVTICISIFRYLSIYIITCQMLKEKISYNQYMLLFIRAVSIYVITTLVFIIIPPLREFWSAIIVQSDHNERLTSAIEYVSRYGLQGFSGFMHTCMCNIGVAFSLFLIDGRIKHRQSIVDLLIYVMIMMVGSMCYGRVGLLGGILLISGYVCYRVLIRAHIKLLLAIIGSLIILSYGIYYIVQMSPEAEYWFNWAFEPFVNYFDGNDFSTSSSNHLKTMYFMPSFKTILFGDGLYMDPITKTYYMQTDVGLIRPVLFWGIIPTTLAYIIGVVTILGICPRSKSNNITSCCDNLCLLRIMLFCLMFFYELKGEAFHYIIMVIFPLLFIHNNTNRESI